MPGIGCSLVAAGVNRSAEMAGRGPGRRRSLWLLSALALIGAAPAPEAKWERIFDGKTLNGWTPKITGRAVGEDPLGMFVVEQGAIRVSHANYPKFEREFGHLFWKKPLRAFRIRFDYRLFGETLPGTQVWQQTNSGLMFHAQAPETIARDQQFPVSLEMQLLATPRQTEEPTGNLCTPGTNVHIGGRLETKHCLLSSSKLMPAGIWTHAEVEVLASGEITHRINGETVLHYADPELDPSDQDARPLIAAAGGNLKLSRGYIALQSEGHPVEFRNIELLTLE